MADFGLTVAEYIDSHNHLRTDGEIGLVPPADFEATRWATTSDQLYCQNPTLTDTGTT